jgi:hypothetical protein
LSWCPASAARASKAIQAAARQLGFSPYTENLLIAAGWTIGRLRAFVEEA